MDASAKSSQSTEPCISTEREKPEPWIRFGPVYGDEDTGVDQRAKQSAWSHITSNGGSEYLSSIASVKDAAKNWYDSSIVDRVNRDPHRFVEMMAKDGCFFLQLALHILGAGDLLAYPPTNPYFGEVNDSSDSWIPAMFFVGNQIPYVVINVLMEQAFFKNVIAEGMKRDTWKRLRKKVEKDLVKLAIYKVVVEPQVMKSKKRGYEPPPSPSNILEALRNLFLGSKHEDLTLTPHGIRAFPDLETGSDCMSRDIFPSATTLSAISGIKLKKGERGITNIKFMNFGFSAYLYLPPFTVNSHTEILLTSLIRYEKMFHETRREVTAYFCLMKDLILTYEDIHILERQGIIIQLKDQSLKDVMISMLHKSDLLRNSNFTPNFSEMRRKIREYELVPWRLISFVWGIVTFIVAVLTVVQTVFTVLTYYHNPRT